MTKINIHGASREQYNKLLESHEETKSMGSYWVTLILGDVEIVVFNPSNYKQ